MNPSPRPPSPTARAATQRAHRRENPNQLSSRDAEILMSLKSKNKGSLNGDLNGDRPKLDAVFVDEHNATKTSGSSPPTPNIKKTQSKVAPPRPSREMRRALSNNARSSVRSFIFIDVDVRSLCVVRCNSRRRIDRMGEFPFTNCPSDHRSIRISMQWPRTLEAG